jgi:hypothetical protein
VIATNATEFNSKGHASLTAVDEFANVPNEIGLTLGIGSAELSGTFQPARSEGPVAVPLPPAMYGGMAMLAGIVVARVRREK